jgi:hypothetical protein
MLPWPIVPPMVLANFMTGDNTDPQTLTELGSLELIFPPGMVLMVKEIQMTMFAQTLDSLIWNLHIYKKQTC